MRPFGSKSDGKTLQLVQRGTDKRIPVELVKQPSGEVLDPAELEELSVKVASESGAVCATIPHTIEDGKLVVEVTADISRQLGLGVYTMTATGRIPDPAYDDGYHDYEIVVDLCKVTKYGSNETPVKVQANVLEGLRGLNNYQLAVKHGYQGTEEEWLKTLKGESGDDAYEVAKKAGYTGSREEWLKTLIGATGLSAYELAKAEGYEGSLTEWVASLKGADGDSAYKVAVRNGYVGDEQTWLASLRGSDGKDAYEVAKAGGYRGSREEWIASLKGDTGKNAYELARDGGYQGTQVEWVASLKGEKGDSAYTSYLATTTDSTPMTEKQWSNANDFFYQFLFRILKGAGVQPTETDMTADQVYALEKLRGEIARALRGYGMEINDEDGLEAVLDAVRRGVAQPIVIYTTKQFGGSKNTILPPMQVWEGWSAPSFDSLFINSVDLLSSPKIIGAERVVSLNRMFEGSASVRGGVSLPDMPKCETAVSAFFGCKRLESVSLGNMPECTSLYNLCRGCNSIRTLSIGDAPKCANIQNLVEDGAELLSVKLGNLGTPSVCDFIFNGCTKLQRVDGVIDLSSSSGHNSAFRNCTSLAEIRIKGVAQNVNLQWSSNLSLESVRYLVDNAQSVSGKIITLHRALLEAYESELTEIGDTASDKGWTINYR